MTRLHLYFRLALLAWLAGVLWLAATRAFSWYRHSWGSPVLRVQPNRGLLSSQLLDALQSEPACAGVTVRPSGSDFTLAARDLAFAGSPLRATRVYFEIYPSTSPGKTAPDGSFVPNSPLAYDEVTTYREVAAASCLALWRTWSPSRSPAGGAAVWP